MMDESFSGNKVNIAAESDASDAYENSRRGDYLFIGFIGILLAGVVGYLVLNPDESTLRSGIKIEKSDANMAMAEPKTTHTVVHAAVKPEAVSSSQIASEPAESESAVVEPVAAKPEVVKSEVTELAAAKPVVAKPVAPKPEVVKPEGTESVAAKPVVASAPRHENKPQANSIVWAVNLVSFSSLDSAKKEMEHLKSQGIVTEMIEVKIGGHTFYRVRISNLGSRKEAVSLRSEFGSRPEYEGVWISSYRK